MHECHGGSACSVPAEDTQNKTHARMQVKHGILYLHHPLKHMGQREEGDEHIFIVGLQYALDDNKGEEEEEEGTDTRGQRNRGEMDRKI